MIQNVLQNFGGIQGYGIVSLCLFFCIFAVMLAWAMTRAKSHLDQMARLPLEETGEDKAASEGPGAAITSPPHPKGSR